ncbi:MAG: holo-ACP synthase [Longimicrobiales bacterium]
MIVGIGTDLVDVARIRAFRDRWGARGLRRLFHDHEIDYCASLADPAPSLAARFAAKEAFFKAVGTGWGAGGAWTDVAVRRGPTGDPELVLTGRAADTARTVGAEHLHVSLTHTHDTAAAFVILEG